MFAHADQSKIQFPSWCSSEVQNDEPQIEDILKCVSEYFNIGYISIKNKRLSHSLRFPRQVAIYLAVQLTSQSYRDIGHVFSGRSAATIRGYCLRTQNLANDNYFIKQIINDISRTILRNTK